MDPFLIFWIFLIGVIAGILAGVVLVYKPLRKKIGDLESEKRRLSTTYGMISEKFAPFMDDYPFDSRRFRFIGSPIDGIQFEDDQIFFIEFKTSDSRLNKLQKKIKDLVEKKKVGWYQFRMK